MTPASKRYADYSRKHAIKLMGAKCGWGGDALVLKGPPCVYGAEVAEVFWNMAKAAEYPCGKRFLCNERALASPLRGALQQIGAAVQRQGHEDQCCPD